jgi:hypothetical protein
MIERRTRNSQCLDLRVQVAKPVVNRVKDLFGRRHRPIVRTRRILHASGVTERDRARAGRGLPKSRDTDVVQDHIATAQLHGNQ